MAKLVSKTYGEALFEVAVEEGTVDLLMDEVTAVLEIFESNEEYTKYSFPSKNMEYMSSGTPVLTTKLIGIPDEYFNYTYLIEEENTDGIKNKLIEIFSKSKNELKKVGRKAQLYVLKNKNKRVQGKKIKTLLSNDTSKSKEEKSKMFKIYGFFAH